jgi:signal transduction histidine kinase
VSQYSELIDRVVVASRRITGTPEWPVAVGALLGVLALIEVVLRANESQADPSIAMLPALATTLPLAFVRTHLVAAALVISSATLLTLAGPQPLTAAGLATVVAVFYLLGRHRSWQVCALMLLPYVVLAVVARYGEGTSGRLFAVLLAVLTTAAVVVGGARRTRLEAVEREESQATVAHTLLEHAARGERARIARELHDVVAHHISMISVQAEAARLTTPGMPAEGAARLLAIGDTARTALAEMRRLLGVLREDAGTDTTREPQPGLQQLNELIDDARDSAAACTRLIVHGHVVPLDPGIELTTYRIVQEALTNARRHAPGAAVDVELDYKGEALHVCIRDNGPGSLVDAPANGSPGEGHGLLGMRERAATLGGTLHAGPAPVNGFLVEATLPTATGHAAAPERQAR